MIMNSRKSTGPERWCCVQAGHREQYGIPRALQRVSALDTLITDLWAPPGSLVRGLMIGRQGRRLRDRFHVDLPPTKVVSLPWHSITWEATARLRGLRGGALSLARNDWWAALSARALRAVVRPSTRYVFGYCYESRALFAAARELGLSAVLGQIDPGPVEDQKVAGIVRRWPNFKTTFQPGDEAYYRSWSEECRLAGRIVVNSEWARSALVTVGVAAEKIIVCPLVYSPPPEAVRHSKEYPASFSGKRPLRVLFLGQCILRKGIAEAIEAARMLHNRPVEFTFVGNTDISGLEAHFGDARIRHFPRVSRAECHAFYREADLFLFPTHSDGFGLTQLEAQAWKLPIIASGFCGSVVVPGRTGWILPDVSSDSIARIIEGILGEPGSLSHCSRAIGSWPFDLHQLGLRLMAPEAGSDEN